MTAPVTTSVMPATGPAPTGDGTTSRSRAGRRWRKSRAPLLVLALLLVGGLLAVLPAPRTSTTPLAPDNPGASGARALAQILQRHGVQVHYVRSLAAAEKAAGTGSTLLVLGDMYLTPAMVDRIGRTSADLVLVETPTALETLAPGVAPSYGGSTADVRSARCDDEDAVAAGTVSAAGALRANGPRVTVCFPEAGAGGEGGALAVVDGARRVSVLTDASLLTNRALPDQGNAALAIRLLGRHPDLVWYLPSSDDLGADRGSDGGTSLTDLMPPWMTVVGLLAVAVALAAALWRGRRLGPVVSERLPVVVRAGETTRGRGRLYRQARAHAHAAAALRAGAATRSAARLGLPRSAGRAAVVDAVSRATGRQAEDVDHLLYGSSPTDDRGLAQLARELDHLESEVHRS